MICRKKLIEVALPLEKINQESAREKSIRHGHPSTLHLWWARRPLAACRAVLFASIVDDPDQKGVPEALLQRIDRLPMPEKRPLDWESLSVGEQRRQKLLAFIERLVPWENSKDEEILRTARELIHAATDGNPPPVLDPFCGGGSIPLEAQRLGLEAHASDLNPVAVLITKALVEIPPKFAGMPPVNPVDRARGVGAAWKGAAGLAADVRYYGKWMRDEAFKRIGHLYPKVKLPKEYGGGEATVIAWLWARTIRCPNPACGAEIPLVRSYWLSTKQGGKAWIEPIVDRNARTVRFEVRGGSGLPPEPPKLGRGASFRCPTCDSVAVERYVRAEGIARRMGSRLLAIAAQGTRGRVYLSPTAEHEDAALGVPKPVGSNALLSTHPQYMAAPRYGFTEHQDLFTARQLLALNTFRDLIGEARERVAAAGRDNAGVSSSSYANAVATYLTFALDKAANYWSSFCSWHQSAEKLVSTFGLPVLGMVWDYTEANPLSDSTGNWMLGVEQAAKSLEAAPASGRAKVRQFDATRLDSGPRAHIVSTDPPYYDNVPYADLSDFFYVWLRSSLGEVYPELFATLLTPKGEEIVADQIRHGGSARARRFFERGLVKAFTSMTRTQRSEYPLTIFYAFKQTESRISEGGSQVASTGWETMLEGLIQAGLSINGTWPMRTEQAGGLRESARNALASSIVLVCRPRPVDATVTTRRDFAATLKRELPRALRNLQRGNIAPVDLAQAAIGPGMAVFSRYSKVLEPDGKPMSVRTALGLINQALDEVLAEQESEYDAETRWAVAWFEQFGMAEGAFGVAETLSKAKDTAVNAMVDAGIVAARGGKVRLLSRSELPTDWDPTTDRRVTVWEVTQHLVRALDRQGEEGAAALLAKVGGLGEAARDLAYRLFSICERKGWAQEALPYNSLVVAWPEIARLASGSGRSAMDKLL